jgi:hypothetical protein
MVIEVEEVLDLDPKHSLRCGISSITAEEIGYNFFQDWLALIP